ncbi:hypothetical protein AGMMS49525_18360 [Bacteroidia bacterium]|nr:hypothetical protein AGMMS49525_18360 [Bacteroidia bacterium]
MKKTILFLAVILLFSSCEIFEDYDERTYYKVEGVGYVYNEYTKEPVENVEIMVGCNFEGRPFGTVQPEYEYFETDAQGYFHVRFLKRYHKSNVVGITIGAHADNNKLSAGLISFTVDKIKKSQNNILNLDTLWLH